MLSCPMTRRLLLRLRLPESWQVGGDSDADDASLSASSNRLGRCHIYEVVFVDGLPFYYVADSSRQSDCRKCYE